MDLVSTMMTSADLVGLNDQCANMVQGRMTRSAKGCYGSEKKKWTEEPSNDRRCIHLWLSLITSTPASPARISYPHK